MTSSLIVGAMVSSLGSGFVMRYGKWRILLLNNVLLVLSVVASLWDVISY